MTKTFGGSKKTFRRQGGCPTCTIKNLRKTSGVVCLFGRASFTMSRLTRRAIGGMLLAVHFCYGGLGFPLSVSKHRPSKGKGLVPVRCTIVTLTNAPSKGTSFSTSVTTTCLHLMTNASSANRSPRCVPRFDGRRREHVTGVLSSGNFQPRPSPRKGLTVKCNYMSIRHHDG